MPILEVGDDGVLRVPGELLGDARPHAQYELDVQGEVVVLRPASARPHYWEQASLQQRINAFTRWSSTSPSGTPDVPSDSLRREGLYD